MRKLFSTNKIKHIVHYKSINTCVRTTLNVLCKTVCMYPNKVENIENFHLEWSVVHCNEN